MGVSAVWSRLSSESPGAKSRHWSGAARLSRQHETSWLPRGTAGDVFRNRLIRASSDLIGSNGADNAIRRRDTSVDSSGYPDRPSGSIIDIAPPDRRVPAERRVTPMSLAHSIVGEGNAGDRSAALTSIRIHCVAAADQAVVVDDDVRNRSGPVIDHDRRSLRVAVDDRVVKDADIVSTIDLHAVVMR